MKTLNLNEKEYKFDLSVISVNSWTQFMFDVLLARVDNIKAVKTPSIKYNIRDNVAKVVISWLGEKDSYHEFTCHLDEFGRISKNYQDVVSEIWQNKMADYYNEEYVQDLNTKLDEIKVQTK